MFLDVVALNKEILYKNIWKIFTLQLSQENATGQLFYIQCGCLISPRGPNTAAEFCMPVLKLRVKFLCKIFSSAVWPGCEINYFINFTGFSVVPLLWKLPILLSYIKYFIWYYLTRMLKQYFLEMCSKSLWYCLIYLWAWTVHFGNPWICTGPKVAVIRNTIKITIRTKNLRDCIGKC